MEICGCGLIKQSKAGTYTESDAEYCRSCLKPINALSTTGAGRHQFIPLTSVTTLQALPGHRINAVHGVVSMLSGSSGFTATAKGNEALSGALKGLMASAVAMGGNAIVGLSGSTFGAGGGITSAFGGDAVGVMLLGTAVTVEPDAPAD
jgi:uncharacterized protein YbjQ (UPF0145 family)